MRAYKGVTQDMTARLGAGMLRFELGKTYEEDNSKTVRKGFHCCENPFECLSYYSLGHDRFFQVEAEGDIDEDGEERIACTKITFVKELSVIDFAYAGMLYIVTHEDREKWRQSHTGITVEKDIASNTMIAIARGSSPKAKAQLGGVIGLILEGDLGIECATIKKVDGEKIKADTWYRFTADGIEEVAEDET